MKVCNFPMCGRRTSRRFCTKHEQARRKREDEKRGSSSERGYGSWHQKERREALLRRDEFGSNWCDICKREKATVLDHIIPHKGNVDLLQDPSNWQFLCAGCHNSKTAKETFHHGS